jgi:hypothetical protein
MAKTFRDVVAEAKRQGWEVVQTRGGHWRFVPPDPMAPIVYAAGAPSDRRALDNHIARMRRSGFRWPPPGRR